MTVNWIKHLLVCCLWMAMPCQANINVRSFHLSTEQGLGANYVRSITQDSKGYLWMGATNGLIRYDGYSSKLITPANTDNRRLMLDERVQVVQVWLKRFILLRLRGGHYSCYDAQTDRFVDYTGDGTYGESWQRHQLLDNGELWLINAGGKGKVISYNGTAFHSRNIRTG